MGVWDLPVCVCVRQGVCVCACVCVFCCDTVCLCAARVRCVYASDTAPACAAHTERIAAQFSGTDDDRHAAARAVAVGVLAAFHLMGFASEFALVWPWPDDAGDARELAKNGACTVLFALLLWAILRAARRHTCLAAAAAGAVLLATFDVSNAAAASPCDDSAATYLVL